MQNCWLGSGRSAPRPFRSPSPSSRLPESRQSASGPDRSSWVDLRRSASEPAFAEIGHSVFGLSWPKANWRLSAIDMSKRTFTAAQRRGSSRPKPAIGRLLSHSRKADVRRTASPAGLRQLRLVAANSAALESGRYAGEVLSAAMGGIPDLQTQVPLPHSITSSALARIDL